MISHRMILAAVFSLCVAPALFPPSAAGEGQAPEIKAIDIDAGPGIDAARVRQILKLRVGDPCTDSAVDGALRDLTALGDIRAPEIERQPCEGGVRLIIRVRRPPVVGSVELTGNLGLNVDLLREKLAHPVGSVTGRPGFEVDARALESFYRQRGYPFAKVAWQAEEVEGKWQVKYSVESGRHLTLGKVRFEGSRAFGDGQLSDIMKTQPGGLLSEGVYDPYVFEADLAAIAEFYHARGYLDARVGHRLEYDTRKERLLPVVTIEEGSLYRVEQIVIRGSTVFSPPEILRAFRLKQGAPYSELLLREDLRTLEQMYQKKGHMGAAIERHLTFAEKGASVSVEIDVRDEGPAATIERVDIRGNNVTKDHVIRRYITVLPGDPVDPSKLDAIRERLLNTGLFSAAPEGGREAVEVFLEDGSAPGKKNLVVEVNDDIRGQFTIGATWNSDLGPMGLIELVHYNFDFTDWPRDFRDAREGTAFAGGGQQLTIRLAPGPKYSDFRLSWLNPSVADSAYSFGWDLYANEWAAHDYDRGATGVSLTGGRRFLDDKLSVTLTPGYERLTLGNVDSDAAADIRAAEGTYNRHYLTLGVAYDARDDRVEPTKGYLAALDLTNVGSFLGGDVDVVKERVHGAYYATLVDSPRWGKHVMSFTGVLGLTQSTGGDGVPFFERYFTSGVGGNRLRGFEYNGIGPVDRKSGDHVGGECLVLGGAEYTFPLYREVVRGALFLDAGDLERRFGDIGLDHVRVSVGFGLRFRLFGGRLGPISLDFGFPVKKLPTDDRQVFSFSIGGSYQF